MSTLIFTPALLLSLIGCEAVTERDTRLDGQWRIHLQMEKPADPEPDPASWTASGVLVISARIPDYVHNWIEDEEAPSIIGRSYVDAIGFLLPRDSAHLLSDTYSFIPRLAGDLTEQLEGEIAPDGRVRLTLRPHVTHIGIDLDGELSGDTVSGSWLWYGGNPVFDMRGSFKMHRVPRDAAWDSAHSRSRRAARASEADWERDVLTGG